MCFLWGFHIKLNVYFVFFRTEDNSVDRDPHFMLKSRMTGHHMCYDFDGGNDEVMLLLNDEVKGKQHKDFEKRTISPEY